jgi:hypothetical protein
MGLLTVSQKSEVPLLPGGNHARRRTKAVFLNGMDEGAALFPMYMYWYHRLYITVSFECNMSTSST